MTTAFPLAATELPSDAIEVGRIGDAWGVKGWFKVLPHSAQPQALFAARRWYLQPSEKGARTFSGAASMIHAFKILEQNKTDIHLQKLKENYEKYFFAGCSQSLSCVKICPLGLPLDRIQSRANHHLRETKK